MFSKSPGFIYVTRLTDLNCPRIMRKVEPAVLSAGFIVYLPRESIFLAIQLSKNYPISFRNNHLQLCKKVSLENKIPRRANLLGPKENRQILYVRLWCIWTWSQEWHAKRKQPNHKTAQPKQPQISSQTTNKILNLKHEEESIASGPSSWYSTKRNGGEEDINDWWGQETPAVKWQNPVFNPSRLIICYEPSTSFSHASLLAVAPPCNQPVLIWREWGISEDDLNLFWWYSIINRFLPLICIFRNYNTIKSSRRNRETSSGWIA